MIIFILSYYSSALTISELGWEVIIKIKKIQAEELKKISSIKGNGLNLINTTCKVSKVENPKYVFTLRNRDHFCLLKKFLGAKY